MSTSSQPMHLFAIHDVVTDVWTLPMAGHNVADFTRNVAASLQSADVNTNMMARHPEDFELWVIGFYDAADGTILETKREMVGRLSQWTHKGVPKPSAKPDFGDRHDVAPGIFAPGSGG